MPQLLLDSPSSSTLYRLSSAQHLSTLAQGTFPWFSVSHWSSSLAKGEVLYKLKLTSICWRMAASALNLKCIIPPALVVPLRSSSSLYSSSVGSRDSRILMDWAGSVTLAQFIFYLLADWSRSLVSWVGEKKGLTFSLCVFFMLWNPGIFPYKASPWIYRET